jgi:hypothetical protein
VGKARIVVSTVDACEALDMDTEVKLRLGDLVELAEDADRQLWIDRLTPLEDGPDKATVAIGTEGEPPPEGFEDAEVIEATTKLRLTDPNEQALLSELHGLFGRVYDEAAGEQHVNLRDYAMHAFRAVRRRYALLGVGETITTPMARLHVSVGGGGLAEAVLEARHG